MKKIINEIYERCKSYIYMKKNYVKIQTYKNGKYHVRYEKRPRRANQKVILTAITEYPDEYIDELLSTTLQNIPNRVLPTRKLLYLDRFPSFSFRGNIQRNAEKFW